MKIASVVGISLVVLATISLMGTASAATFTVPAENLRIPEEMQACAENLQKIYAAIKKYEKDRGELPNWLSELVPDYLGKEALLCPINPERIKAQYCPDPNLPCSYTYEFSPTRINSRWVFRKWKKQQVKQFGDVVPIVCCIDHGSDTVLNISVGGQVYRSPLVWERMFTPHKPATRSVKEQAVSLEGKPAPSFTLKDLNGKEVSLSDFKGKVVLLDFWGTWCGPCRRAIPHLEALHKKYKDRGLVVIGVNRERDPDKVKQFAKERISYTTLVEADEQFKEYGVRGIPALFYVDGEGKIRHRDVGFSTGKEKEIEHKVQQLLADKNEGVVELEVLPNPGTAKRSSSTTTEAKSKPGESEPVPAKFAIPAENIVTPDQIQACAVNLRRIYSAIRRFEKDANRLPNRLAELVPEYVGKETLRCPHDRIRTGAGSTSQNVPCSYIYDFTSDRVSSEWPIIGGMRFSDWKKQQMRLFGDVVPMVRCSKHGSKYLNVSVSGKTYVSPLVWERMFVPGYTHGDEFRDVAPNKLRSLGERPADKDKGRTVNKPHPEEAPRTKVLKGSRTWNAPSKFQEDSLEVVSTIPQTPTVLSLGERLRVKVRYHLASADQARIWARPYTGGKRTSSYRAHPSPLYDAGSGEMEGWFYFDRQTKVDEVRVKMVSADSKEPIATASLVVDAEWKPVQHPTIGQSNENASPSRYGKHEQVPYSQ